MDLLAGTKPYKTAIMEIAQDTFNTGHNKFTAQFTQLRKNIGNYLQCSLVAEGYLVAHMVQTGKIDVQLAAACGPKCAGKG